MATEIFIEPELENLQDSDNAAEWQLICEELKLSGQLTLTEKTGTNHAPPYMAIDPKTERIIRVLCPAKTEVEKYAESTIPLDILSEVHKCKEHGWYHSIHVYYDNKSPDPFVVGFVNDKWDSPKHLIARWGAELLPFELLEQKAIQRMKNDAMAALYEMKAQIDFAYNNIEGFLASMLAGKEPPTTKIVIPDLKSWTGDLPF